MLLSALGTIILTGCNTPKSNNSMKPMTNFEERLKCKCTAKILNLVGDGIVNNVDVINKSITIKHDNGITSVFKNMEQIAPPLLFTKNKEVLKGYILGAVNSDTIYEQIEFK